MLSNKVIGSLIIVFMLLAIPYSIQKWVILPSFSDLEQELARDDMARVIDAIEREIEHLGTMNISWSSWDDTYQFMKDDNEAYKKSNFNIDIFKNAEIQLWKLYDNVGNLVFGDVYNENFTKHLKLPMFSLIQLPEKHIFLQHNIEKSLFGFINSQAGLMVINSRPVLKSNTEGPIVGTSIMGRFFSDTTFLRLANQTKVDFTVLPITASTQIFHSDIDIAELLNGEINITAVSTDLVEMHAVMLDIYGKPTLIVHGRIPRDITKRGLQAAQLASISILVSLVIVTSALLLLFFKQNSNIRHINKRIQIQVEERTEELKRAKEEAEQANKSKGDFLANMSHEIRTPMNAILGMSDLCQRTELSVKQKRYINNIYYSAESLLHLLNNILDFSKIDAGMVELERVDFSLDDALSSLEVLTNELIRKKNIPLIFDVKPNFPCLLNGDLLRLGQVVLNIVQNAIKFTETGAVYLRIRTLKQEKNTHWVEFLIEDSGIGMSHESVANIFEEFTQADSSTTRKYGGTGLGLSICKQLVKLMGGTITLTSELGIGTEVKVILPFEHTFKSNRDVADALVTKSVMIISENQQYATAISNTLASYGCKVVTVRAFSEAPELLADHELCLIDDAFSDIKIIEYIVKIQQYSSTTKNILLTNKVKKEKLASSFNIDFLAKSVHLNSFIQASQWLLIENNTTNELTPINKSVKKARALLLGKNILLAEDNEINRQIIIELLDVVGIKVIVAENGQRALSLLEHHQVDAILMDMQMPIMDGIEATKAIRNQSKWQPIPIIALTASAMEGDKEKGLAIGMNDYLTKPIFPELLYNCLMLWCANKDPQTNDVDIKQFKEVNTVKNADILNIAAGLKVCAGKHQLLEKLWLKFIEQHKNTGQHFEQQINTHDYNKASAILHNIIGVSGNIGALKLRREVEKIQQILENNNTDINDEHINIFKTELDSVFEAITQQTSV